MTDVPKTNDVDKRFEIAYQCYEEGDYKSAFDKYLELAELGYSNCQAFIGGLYYSGKGVEQDLRKARVWLEKAVIDNDSRTQFLLGKICAQEGNYTNALTWYEKASEQGYAPAIYKQAIYIEKGRAGFIDKERVLSLYRQAAMKQHLYAKRTLAFRLLKGWGGFLGFFEGLSWLYRTIVDGYKLGLDVNQDNDSIRV